MAITHVVNLLSNDDLRDVIQKSNYNFNIIMKTMRATKLKDAADIEERVNALAVEVASLSADVSQIGPKADAAIQVANQVRGEMDQMETAFANLEIAVAGISSRLTVVETTLATIQTTLTDHENRIQALEDAS